MSRFHVHFATRGCQGSGVPESSPAGFCVFFGPVAGVNIFWKTGSWVCAESFVVVFPSAVLLRWLNRLWVGISSLVILVVLGWLYQYNLVVPVQLGCTSTTWLYQLINIRINVNESTCFKSLRWTKCDDVGYPYCLAVNIWMAWKKASSTSRNEQQQKCQYFVTSIAGLSFCVHVWICTTKIQYHVCTFNCCVVIIMYLLFLVSSVYTSRLSTTCDNSAGST